MIFAKPHGQKARSQNMEFSKIVVVEDWALLHNAMQRPKAVTEQIPATFIRKTRVSWFFFSM
jgi:hypothetical protein